MSSEGKSQFELAQDMIKETNRGGWNQSPQQLLSHLQTNGVLTSSLPLAFPLGSLGESISNSEPAVCRFFPRAPSLQMAPASLQWLKQNVISGKYPVRSSAPQPTINDQQVWLLPWPIWVSNIWETASTHTSWLPQSRCSLAFLAPLLRAYLLSSPT